MVISAVLAETGELEMVPVDGPLPGFIEPEVIGLEKKPVLVENKDVPLSRGVTSATTMRKAMIRMASRLPSPRLSREVIKQS